MALVPVFLFWFFLSTQSRIRRCQNPLLESHTSLPRAGPLLPDLAVRLGANGIAKQIPAARRILLTEICKIPIDCLYNCECNTYSCLFFIGQVQLNINSGA